MSEKRFEFYSDEDLIGVLDTVTGKIFNSFEIVDYLNEQQATIRRLQNLYKTMLMNWDSLVEKASEISLRNIELDEQIGRLQRENEQLKKAREHYREIDKEMQE